MFLFINEAGTMNKAGNTRVPWHETGLVLSQIPGCHYSMH